MACLVEVLGTAIGHERLDDAEDVLKALRHLRPQLAELVVFDAWISIRRLDWLQALRTIRGAEERILEWPLGKALLAFCQYATGDAVWICTADQVISESDSAEAKDLMRLLLGEKDPDEHDSIESSTTQPSEPGEAAAPDNLLDEHDWRVLRA